MVPKPADSKEEEAKSSSLKKTERKKTEAQKTTATSNASNVSEKLGKTGKNEQLKSQASKNDQKHSSVESDKKNLAGLKDNENLASSERVTANTTCTHYPGRVNIPAAFQQGANTNIPGNLNEVIMSVIFIMKMY